MGRKSAKWKVWKEGLEWREFLKRCWRGSGDKRLEPCCCTVSFLWVNYHCRIPKVSAAGCFR